MTGRRNDQPTGVEPSRLPFEALLEAAPAAILIVDPRGRIELVNARAEELFGYERHELVGGDVDALVAEGSRELHASQRAECAADARTPPVRPDHALYGLHKDGSEFPIEISLGRLSSGPETLICAIVRDLAWQKAVEAERLDVVRAQTAEAEAAAAQGLQEVTEAALGDLSLDDLLQSALEPVRASLNASAARILLFDDDRGELVVRASIGAGPTETAVAIGEGIAGAIAAQTGPGLFEGLVGSVEPELAGAGLDTLVGAPLRVAGSVVGVIYAAEAAPHAFTADDARLLQRFADRIALGVSNAWLFDAEREARAANEAAQGRLSEMIADLAAILWEADTPDRSRLTFVGGDGLGMLGYPLEQWTAEPHFWRHRIHPDDRARTLLFFAEAAAERRDHELEYRLHAADGRVVWVNDKVRVVDAEQGPPRLRGVMVDVTERRELAARLLHSQKMDAVGQLAGGVAHDFNNLLTVITGFANLLAARLGAEAGTELEEIRRAANQAASVTGQLLAFSRRDQRESELVDLNDLVSNVEQMIRRLIGEDVWLTVTRSPEPALVKADPSRLEQVLVNLVVNARDAMPRGGEIGIALSTETGNGATDASALPPGRLVLLRVSDTGSGMSEETVGRIFEPFFTTKPQGEGTGLGLATVYAIVEQAGGHISVESEPGRGTEFTVALPAATAPVPTEEAQATILVAEDEPALRKLARVVLEQDKYRVLEAASGRDALEVAARYPGTIDLVLTDIVMPGMGGPQLVAELTSLRPEVGVIYMSGYTDSRIAGRDERDALLPKPFDPDQLKELVRVTLEKRSREIFPGAGSGGGGI